MKRKRVKSAVSLICTASLIFGDLSLGNIDFNLFATADEVSDGSETDMVENITGYGWWNLNNQTSSSYPLGTEDEVVAVITSVEGDPVEFCVEAYDDSSWFTTTSQGDAWFAGAANTEDAVIKKGEVNSNGAEFGHTYYVTFKRKGDSLEAFYWDATSKTVLWQELSGVSGATLSDNVKVHVLAQIGSIDVSWKTRDELDDYVSNEVEINETNFPDEIFRSYVKENYDADGDGKLSVSEWASVTSISVGYKGIETLEGIEYFTNLEELYCYGNALTSLEVSGLTNLSTLSCSRNQLTSLEVSGLTNLHSLSCYDNQLTNLEVNALTNLSTLSCSWNQLTSLEVSGLTNLSHLDCGGNQLRSLEVSGLTNLSYLSCDDNQLTSLEVSGLTNLSYLSCDDNQLTSLEVSRLTNLSTLSCDDNQLTSLEVSRLTNLSTLSCSRNQLTNLEVSGLTNLSTLSCDDNQLTSLEVSRLTNLSTLSCSRNQLTNLEVSGLTNLSYLSCYDNQLRSLEVSGLEKLTYLNCRNNSLYSFTVNESFDGEVYSADNYYCLNNQDSSKNVSLGSLPGLDSSRIVNIRGGVLQDGMIQFEDNYVSYDYDIGNGTTQSFGIYLLNASYDNISFQLEDGDTLKISGNGEIRYDSTRCLRYCTIDVSEIIIDEGITSFEAYSYKIFQECRTIHIPASCTDIHLSAMEHLENIIVSQDNPDYMVVDNLLYTKDQTALVYVPYNITELEIPESVKTIKEYACCNCTELKKITIPANVETIEDYSIPNSVTVEFEPGSKLKKLGNIFPYDITDLSMLENTKELEEIYLGGKVADFSIFRKLPALKSVTGIYATYETQEFFTENVEYNLTFTLGEKMQSSYSESEYEAVNGSGKIPVKNGWIKLVEIESSLFDENGVACKAGSEKAVCSTHIRLLTEDGENLDYVYAQVPVTITVVDWDTNPALENDEDMELELDVDNDNWAIKDANNDLWQITDIKDFKVERKAENIKEYVADRVYIDTVEDNSLHEREYSSLRYLTQENVLYSDGKKVSDHVKKYDAVYALTDSGELKNMEGQTIMTDVKDFASIGYYSGFSNTGYASTWKCLVLKKDGTLLGFTYDKEQDLQLIDSDVLELSQGQISEYTNSACVEYLKTNGDLYSVISLSIRYNEHSELTDSDVKEILSFNVVRKTDDSIWYSGYVNAAVVTKKLFEAGDNIIHAYNTDQEDEEVYAGYKNFGELENYIFVDSNGSAWGINAEDEKILLTEQFEKYIPGGFVDKNGIKYLYADGQLKENSVQVNAPELTIEDQVLYRNGIAIMTNVVSADRILKRGVMKYYYIFTRTDGTIWLMDPNKTDGNYTPVCVSSFAKTDKNTGIDLTYEDGTPFAGDIDIHVSDVTDDETYSEYAKAAEKLGTSGQLFDIYMTSNGVIVQPDGNLKVSIPLPEGISESSAKVYHIDEAGNSTDMNAAYEDGKLTFVTDHFSVYAVVSSGIKGDANGDGKINIKDSALVRRYVAGWDVEINESASDVNGDGKINIKDSALIRRYAAGWDVEFK